MENFTSFEDLEKLVMPLIRTATKIEVNQSSHPPKNSQLISHFGGHPYFETDEKWPKSKKGNNLDFIFQIFNNQTINLPPNIKLVQFFYDWEEAPWNTIDDGWLVKIYETLNTERITKIEKPNELAMPQYCEIAFKTIQSLPDWEGIKRYSDKASKLSCDLNKDKPWYNYQTVVEKLIGKQNSQSQIGGYPYWVQAESTPDKSNGEPMKLLFQIDSEENAEITWEDSGIIYIFYDESNKQIKFTLQCC